MNTESNGFDLIEIGPSNLYTYYGVLRRTVYEVHSQTVMNHTDRRASAVSLT
jgi:hypothetical protein